MRTALLALLLSAANLMAQTHILKPTDFEPLTSLPWKQPNATLESTLKAIFLEPDVNIRYPVLAEYLRTIPVGQLGKAFDICTNLDGTQSPNELVSFLLEIWARRDPVACWKRTQELFRVVGIEGGWLGYGQWSYRITVQDRSAIQASPFWLKRSALKSFPLGVEASPLPAKERIQIMREFAEKWFAVFGSWPGNGRGEGLDGYLIDAPETIQVFLKPLDQLPAVPVSQDQDGHAASIIAERRLLEADVSSAPEILKKLEQVNSSNQNQWQYYPVSGFLLLWMKLDQAGMIHWADSLDIVKDAGAFSARALVMGRVDAGTRARWLAAAKTANTDEDLTPALIEEWARWDPAAGLAAAVATNDCETITETAQAVAYGPFYAPTNGRRFGLEVIKNFDVGTLPVKFRDSIVEEWDEVVQSWGAIDAGEAARYGVDFLSRFDPAHQAELIRYFGGEDVEGDEAGGVPMRTFCLLRVWAVVRPDEMKAWIATLKDAEMRKALTWLLNHPWGN